MLIRDHDHNDAHEIVDEKDEWTGPKWTEKELKSYIERNGTCVLLIDGYVADVTRYMKTHVRSLSQLFLSVKSPRLLMVACSLGGSGCCVSMLCE